MSPLKRRVTITNNTLALVLMMMMMVVIDLYLSIYIYISRDIVCCLGCSYDPSISITTLKCPDTVIIVLFDMGKCCWL